MSVVLIDIYLLVPKIHLSHVVLELYKPKQMKNSTKNEAPEVVICDFCYNNTFILLHTCFQCVLLSEAGHSRQSLSYFKIIVHFYVSSNITGLHFGAKKAKNHVLWDLKH